MGNWNKRKKYTVDSTNGGTRPRVHFSGFMKRQSLLTMLGVLGVVMIFSGSTYAIFSSVSKSASYNTIQVGTLQIAYDDTSSGMGDIINLNGIYPISDTEGQALTPYKFTIKNTGTLSTSFKVRIIDDEAMINTDGDTAATLLDKANIKYSINGGPAVILSTIGTTSPTWTIDMGTLAPSASKTYQIRMWIKSDAGNEILGKHFHGKIVIEGAQ